MNGLLWLHQEQVSSVRFAHANVDRRRWHTSETFAFARGGRKAGVGAAEAASADAARMIMTSAEARTTHILLDVHRGVFRTSSVSGNGLTTSIQCLLIPLPLTRPQLRQSTKTEQRSRFLQSPLFTLPVHPFTR